MSLDLGQERRPESIESLFIIIHTFLPSSEALWILHVGSQNLHQAGIERLLQLGLPLC